MFLRGLLLQLQRQPASRLGAVVHRNRVVFATRCPTPTAFGPASQRLFGTDQRSLATSSSSSSSSFESHTYIAIRAGNCVLLQNQQSPTGNDESQKYPLVWLRDNCQCPECFHRQSTSRIIDWTRFDVDVQPKDISFNNDTATLSITWSDAHHTEHTLDWLRQRSFNPAAQKEYARSGYRPARIPWSPAQFARIAHEAAFDYNALINNDSALRDWLHHLAVHGVAMIENTPLAGTSVRQLADRVGFIRHTHYGDEFHVRNEPLTQNVAYLSTPLQMHTDLPYYEFAPGVNLLHCVEQSHTPQGAFNMLADGLWVAQRMRDEWPQEFELLTRTEVDWLDVGVDGEFRFHKRFRAPVICLDREGNVQRVNHSVPQRDSRFTCPLEEVEPWYRAQAKFVELIYAEAVHFKTRPGDVLTFDNARLVHGRTGYTDVGGNVRHVIGAYLDWDEIYSRLRVLDDQATAEK